MFRDQIKASKEKLAKLEKMNIFTKWFRNNVSVEKQHIYAKSLEDKFLEIQRENAEQNAILREIVTKISTMDLKVGDLKVGKAVVHKKILN